MSVTRRGFGIGGTAAVVVAAMLPSARPALADLRLDINRGQVQPLPIAIPPFPGEQAGGEIAGVVSNDLQGSGLFQPIDPHSFIDKVAAGSSPNFADWKQINAQALVTGSVADQGGGKLRVEFRLWDVFAGQQLAGFAYTTTPQNWRRIAHIIADEVYKRITGEDGYFDTRIVYVAESGPAQTRDFRRRRRKSPFSPTRPGSRASFCSTSTAASGNRSAMSRV